MSRARKRRRYLAWERYLDRAAKLSHNRHVECPGEERARLALYGTPEFNVADLRQVVDALKKIGQTLADGLPKMVDSFVGHIHVIADQMRVAARNYPHRVIDGEVVVREIEA